MRWQDFHTKGISHVAIWFAFVCLRRRLLSADGDILPAQ